MSYRAFKWMPLAAAGLALACAAGAARASDSGGSVVYRWVDNSGVVHYGDRIPPQYAQSATTILNRDGVVIGRLSAAESTSQLAKAAHERQQRQQQQRLDTFLLTTYTSVADIKQLRNQRIAQIDNQREAAAQYASGLRSRLLALQARAMLYKPYNPGAHAQRLPNNLAGELVHTLNELRSARLTLKQKRKQEAAIRTQFHAEIVRYRELTSDQAHSSGDTER